MTTLWDRLPKDWRDKIAAEFVRSNVEKPEKLLQRIELLLESEKAAHKVYPKDEEIFNALNLTAFHEVRVVILGQDPYFRPGQAHGLCFSVPKGKEIPGSLRNIFKEIDPINMPTNGDLTVWAKQGVLLLNATLTVREAEAGSHKGQGWEELTDAIIRALSAKRKHVVFLLWGADAQKKRELIARDKHCILEASHPSPRSANRKGQIPKFRGCDHFKKANDFLREHILGKIDWQIAPRRERADARG